MPRLHPLIFVAVIAGFVQGCGGEKPQMATTTASLAASAAQPVAGTATTSVQATGISKQATGISKQATGISKQATGISKQATGESAPVPLPVNADSPPSDVVMAFLNAMRDGTSAVASELLTEQARAETAKHQWPVQPPGAPSATYQLGQASFVDDSHSGVHVPCLWTEPDGAGGTIEFEVVWALRRLGAGWRVAGFATEVVPGKPPFFFNFEDIANLKETQAAAEAALVAAAAAEPTVPNVAEHPAGGQIVR